MYNKSTIFLVGDSKAAGNNPITYQFSAYFIALVIDEETGAIVDAGATATIPMTYDFIRSMFVGYCMDLGLEPMIDEINRRYHGSSQKAMIVAWKDAFKKYEQITKGDR